MSNATRSVTVYERSSKTLEKVAAMAAGNEVYLPMEFLLGRLSLQRKSLPGGKVGICRDDLCVPFRVGEDADCIRVAGDTEFVPARHLSKSLRGTIVWDDQESELLLDLTSRSSAASATGDLSLNLTLPDLAGNPVTLSDFRGKKVLVFAWASW